MPEEIATIRERIGDEAVKEIEKYASDGTRVDYAIHNKNPFSITVRVDDTPNSDWTYDAELNKVIFNDAPANNTTIAITYLFAAFTDAEIQSMITKADSDLDVATAEALRRALGSQARMVSFQHGDRSVSLSDIFKNLMSLLDRYEKRVSNTGANASQVIVGRREMNDAKIVSNPEDISRLFFR